jgi:hypothetical protein
VWRTSMFLVLRHRSSPIDPSHRPQAPEEEIDVAVES